ncbi:MAG TPA: ABC transporter permease [Chloroflexota bacterium]|jgi:peptide/nickel transport system permease protein
MIGATRLALLYLALLLVLAIAGSALAPYDPFALSQEALSPPTVQHLMGTDNIGRDIFSGIIVGSRTALSVGFFTALVAVMLGVVVGALSGYFGRATDLALMRVAEFFQMFPVFFLAIVIVTLTGPGLGKVIIVLGIASWPGIARLVRVSMLSLKKSEFAEAAIASGCSNQRLIVRHILPNGVAPAIVAASFIVGRSILAEAGLSFLGLGDPSLVSWGQMLNNAQQYLTRGWWLALFPGIAIALTVIATNALGDALNDFMNPRTRRASEPRARLAIPLRRQAPKLNQASGS